MSTQNDNDYDLEPVVYCARCYSLKIRYEEAIDADCCMECGCSDILTSSIEEWEKLYESRYGSKYTERSNDPKTSPIFKFSIKKLKEMVFESDSWEYIIKRLYPRFQKGLKKSDSIILLFDRLIHDNRLDDLRYLLVEQFRKRTNKSLNQDNN